jgi:Asp-tRNA(Asn)/Glu-tRNA(Gln) amidotransferase C subunit
MIYEIRARVEAYLREELTLEDITSWLMQSLQAILDSGDSEAISVADKLDTLLIDSEDGRLDRESFLDSLRELAAGQVTVPKTYVETDPVAACSETSAAVSTVRDAVMIGSMPVEDLRFSFSLS